MSDIPDSDKLVFDIYSTLLELLITLSSAVVVGLITFFGDVKAAGIPPWAIGSSVLLFALAILSGILALMKLSGELSGGANADREFNYDTAASDILYEQVTRLTAASAFFLYFSGMFLLAVTFFCARIGCNWFCAPTAG